MKYLCSLLVVKDIKKSLELYRDVLGLEIELDLGENVSFKGGLTLHNHAHFSNLINKKISLNKTHTGELYFEEDDIEGIFSVIEEKYELVHGIVVQPWQQRVFRFYDLDNHVIEIGESLEAVVLRLRAEYSDEEITKLMGMPMAFVKNV